jgi:hypothetical protein
MNQRKRAVSREGIGTTGFTERGNSEKQEAGA